MKKNIIHKSVNGYSLYMSLIVLFLLIQCVSYISVLCMQSVELMKCNKQSMIDLAIISHAKAIIENNTMIRECNFDSSQLILKKEVEVNDKKTILKDCDTYIQCIYEGLEYHIYYDEMSISGLEIFKIVD
ncbi:hypothetical protein [Floccifex sp.]|uniref:hypothetical protein n=1 Tax=Floccifex sp. TaxID=2815810 RepID=UPI002A74DF7E|nr:hypothetical protein [Floccifex sp.]MDD7281378.1 hypothetical protein [Erysipelotrichaceae bacterium]MDY2958083.1 hypothetical protein [Floccifex sp.]